MPKMAPLAPAMPPTMAPVEDEEEELPPPPPPELTFKASVEVCGAATASTVTPSVDESGVGLCEAMVVICDDTAVASDGEATSIAASTLMEVAETKLFLKEVCCAAPKLSTVPARVKSCLIFVPDEVSAGHQAMLVKASSGATGEPAKSAVFRASTSVMRSLVVS